MRSIVVIALLTCLSGCATAKPEAPHLSIAKIEGEKFSLKYEGKTDLPIGTNVRGFVVTKLTPKFKMRTIAGGRQVNVDLSELTLKREDKTIILIKGQRALFIEYIIHLSNLDDMKEYSVRIGEEIDIGLRTLRLREVNVEKQNCELEDVKSGEQFTIKMKNKRPNQKVDHISKGSNTSL